MHVKAEGQVFVKTRSLTDLKPASLARLALFSQHWGYMHAPLCLTFSHRFWGLEFRSSCLHGKHFATEPQPQPIISIF